ncbi:MAG: TonB-dependent receptor [Pseudomonadota bacterium]
MQRHTAPSVPRPALAFMVAVAVTMSSAESRAEAERQNALEQVVVTAQKREESLQEIPIAITAFDTETLEELGVTDIGDLTGQAPGLIVQPTVGGSVNAAISIRGSGLSTNNLSRDASVGLYLDGVPIAKTSGALFDGIDIERMEVLRGPQGTLYGKNTISGAINVIPKKPTGQLGGYATVGVGNENLRTLRASLDAPAVGRVGRGLGELRTKVSYIRRERDGFFENEVAGLEDFDNKDQWGFRFSSVLDVADRFSVEYAYDEFTLDQRPTMLSRYDGSGDRPDSLANNDALQSDVEINGHSLIATYDFGDLQLKSITGYRELETRSHSDFDASALDIVHFKLNNDFEQTSQEFQLVGQSEQFEYVFGLFYYDEEWFTDNPRWLGAFGNPDLYNYDTRGGDTTSYAAFSQATWFPQALQGKLELTAGLRWTRDEKDSTRLQQSLGAYVADPSDPNSCVCVRDENGVPITQSGAPAAAAVPMGPIGPTDLVAMQTEDEWSQLTPMFVATYHFDAGTTGYAKYSTGFKAGGINGVAANNQTFVNGFDQETMDSFELGLKSRLLGDRLQINAAAFYNDYDDIQVNTFVPEMIGISVENAGKARIAGAELELLARPTRNLEFTFNYSFLDTEYDEYLDFDESLNRVRDFSDERKFPYAPEHSFNTALVYESDPTSIGTVSARVDYAWFDDQFIGVNDDPTTNIESYGLLSGRIGLSSIAMGGRGSIDVSVWGKNLTDEEYTQSGVNLGVLGTVNQWGDPRSYGLEVTYRY